MLRRIPSFKLQPADAAFLQAAPTRYSATFEIAQPAAVVWAELARARFQLAGQGENFDAEKGTFTEQGNTKLRGAKQAWEKYLTLEPEKPDERLARLMVQAFDALGDAEGAARAQEVVAEANPDNANVYAQLAALSYAAGLTRKGDLAKDKALELTEPDMREALKGQLESAKQSAAGAAAQPSATP